ncbi:hypothetical protein [Chryseobacterium culicis]|uniref:hypothetical protein n=1 Tax=Chryseobacterium culicis TaxID=680127 RepID=UPI000AEBAFCD|nr:hypothetical protein [Chryseobacterium culicis]
MFPAGASVSLVSINKNKTKHHCSGSGVCSFIIKNHYIYQHKDHLGNARISFARNSAGALEITDANDYYPFGMNHLKTGNAFFGSGTYKNYKFQEQEFQETGFYSFKWRNYMPDVAKSKTR